MELLERLPATWSEFVGPLSTPLTDGQYQLQMAIWELVTTEVAYIHALRTVTDVSMGPEYAYISYEYCDMVEHSK